MKKENFDIMILNVFTAVFSVGLYVVIALSTDLREMENLVPFILMILVSIFGYIREREEIKKGKRDSSLSFLGVFLIIPGVNMFAAFMIFGLMIGVAVITVIEKINTYRAILS